MSPWSLPVKLRVVLLLCHAMVVTAAGSAPSAPAIELRSLFEQQVTRRLVLPPEELPRYVGLLEAALEEAGLTGLGPQLVLVVDRSPNVQAIMVVYRAPRGDYELVGAAPASTGKPGAFEYFETPLGVFRHYPGFPDFRAEGTRNDNGVLGYGPKGMRVYDFGWQVARRTWDGGASLMRFQMHSTDPDLLEPRVGTPQSKGCVRIPMSLNRFIDRYGLIDADYERAATDGMNLWVLANEREPVDRPGRYLVVVESDRAQRPSWSPLPPAVAPPEAAPAKLLPRQRTT